MNRRYLFAIPVVGLLVIVGVAYAFLRTPAAASEPIQAIPIAQATETAAPMAAPPTAEPTATVQAEAPAQPAVAAPPEAAEPWIFAIVQSESEARFIIEEILNGSPKTVVGATDQVAGQIQIDANDLPATRLGLIQVNARTLTTDNSFRNNAIKNRILMTDRFEYVTFTPSELIGLPERVNAGETYSFQVSGDLTIRDVTRPVTFDAQVTPVSTTELQGSAAATILYADFGIEIPKVQSVAWVDDKVILEIDFTARR